MTSKQLLRLAALLGLVLVLWGAVALASRRSEGGSERDSLIPTIDSSAVDTVAITGSADSAILVRTRDPANQWRVNGHPADTQAVGDLLKALANTGSVSELVARNPASHARLRVTDDSGKRVRIVQKGRTLVNVVAGKQTTDGEGVYLRRAGEPAVYALRGDLAAAISRSSEDWRDHTIASVTPDSVAAIEVRRGNRSYTLRRKGNSWNFASGASADSAAVAGLLANYREIKAAGFGSRAQADSLRFGRLRRAARLLDSRGAPLLSLVFDSIPSGIWVRVAEGPGKARAGGGDREPFRLDSWTADQLTPADSSLRKR
jgi:hypothetical protein